MDELSEEMLHQVQHTNRSYLVGGHLDEVVTNFGLLGIQVTSLDENLLLLSDRVFKKLHPRDNVTMRYRELVGSSDLDQLVKRLLILGLRQLEGKFLNLQLSLEQVHWVFFARVWDTMDGNSVLVQTECGLANFVIQLINPCIDLSFEGFNLFILVILHFFDFAFHELFHIFGITKRYLLAPCFLSNGALVH